MFCKHCGNQLPDGAAACTKCGFAVGTGVNHCANCGTNVTPGQAVCINCGAALVAPTPAVDPAQQKSKIVAALLAFFLGFGIYNFYLGYTRNAVIQLILSLTMIAAPIAGVWALIDFIRLLAGNLNVDGKGIPLK